MLAFLECRLPHQNTRKVQLTDLNTLFAAGRISKIPEVFCALAACMWCMSVPTRTIDKLFLFALKDHGQMSIKFGVEVLTICRCPHTVLRLLKLQSSTVL